MPPHEPYRQVKRYSPENAHHLGRISAALGRIKVAEIWPASAEALRFNVWSARSTNRR
jgi:hypothetical protein